MKEHPYEEPLHYEKFSDKLLGRTLHNPRAEYPFKAEQGLYLKMHGSLNWFLCTNNLCPNSDKPWVVTNTNQCLAMSQHGADFTCIYCAGLLTPYLVPPLLNKPILRDKISRNIWGNALSILLTASKIVIIGYSFPGTDFYSEWLFRTALKKLKNVRVWVVNPLNDPDCKGSESEKANYNAARTAFRNRVANITGYRNVSDKYYKFDQISEVLAEVRSTGQLS